MTRQQRATTRPAVRILRPSLRAVRYRQQDGDAPVELLSERQRLLLGNIATELRLRPRMMLYREETPAEWIFVVRDGILKSFRDLSSGRRAVTAFLFSSDLCGLAQNGSYVNSVQAVTPVTLHRIRVDALIDLLHRDAALQFEVLAKVTHELRGSQRQALVLARRSAIGRLAMFLHMVKQRGEVDLTHIDIPMSRADTASYLGLSAEAVTRAGAELKRRGLVEFDGVHSARIVDQGAFDKLLVADD
jgi:CRP-like cAMP-binding protein